MKNLSHQKNLKFEIKTYQPYDQTKNNSHDSRKRIKISEHKNTEKNVKIISTPRNRFLMQL